LSDLDPRAIFKLLAADLPKNLRRHMILVGSLAAAYHFRTKLRRRAVNTKDADVVVHPAGDIESVAAIAAQLLGLGWRPTDVCRPRRTSKPANALQAIRLFPPHSQSYFVELLGLPKPTQRQEKLWTPVRMQDGWYGIPSFRYMVLLDLERCATPEGIDYAHPAMMALANLLSHREVGTQRMSSPIGGRMLLRSAKDLGRVLALVWLAGRDASANWRDPWVAGLKTCWGSRWRTVARRAGAGLEDLLVHRAALDEARHAVETGLLSGRGVSLEALAGVGQQLKRDLLDPLAALASQY
jgi:hypothetical protein